MIRLTDAQLREVQQAAQMVPLDLRQTFLERLALELRGKELGDGIIHRVAYSVARSIVWDAGRMAVEELKATNIKLVLPVV
jgi:hypothetical protein